MMRYEPIAGQPQHATDEEIMSMIRSILTEVDAPKRSRKAVRTARGISQQRDADFLLETSVTEDLQGFKAFVERTLEGKPWRRADDLPELQESAPKADKKPRTPWMVGIAATLFKPLASISRNIRNFRPSTRHFALACIAWLLVLRPHWFVISGVMIAIAVIGVFLVFGSDRIWRGVLSYLVRVEVRNPDRATHLRNRLDRFACRWDGILDHFPDGMVDSLYMPDFQDLQNGDTAHTNAMIERLSRMAHDT